MTLECVERAEEIGSDSKEVGGGQKRPEVTLEDGDGTEETRIDA